MAEPSKASNADSSEGKSLTAMWSHIERIADCMLVTHDGVDLRARPMRGIAKRDDNAIWFVTSKATQKDAEVTQNPGACLCYADKVGNTYLSLSGRVETTDDKMQIRELWNAGADAYFPKGQGDPNVVLLRFAPEFGEYWDAPSNPVVLAIQFIKAKVTGTKPALGENRKVAMA